MTTTAESDRQIDVVCAVIVDSCNHVLATQRSPEKALGGLWEFPGGKVEPGEDHESALRRELQEELRIEVGALQALTIAEYVYSFAGIRLHPFITRCESRPALTLTEHSDYRWCSVQAFPDLKWAPADLPILEELKKLL